MPSRKLEAQYREDYLDRLHALLTLGHRPHMVRLWTNQDGSRTDVKFFMATSKGEVLNVTPHIAHLIGERLWERQPEGWALRLSSGGVNPAVSIGYALAAFMGMDGEQFVVNES